LQLFYFIIFKPYCATSRISKEIFILSAWQKSYVFLICSEHKNVGDNFTIVSLMYLMSFADVMCWIIFMNQAFFGKLKKLILEKMPFFCLKKNVFHVFSRINFFHFQKNGWFIKMIQHVTSAKDFRYLKETLVNFSAEIILNFSMLATNQKNAWFLSRGSSRSYLEVAQ
jgi:hypothetical protein